MIVPYCDTGVFQLFVDQLAREYPKREGVRSLLILDTASWHKTKSLHGHHFEPTYLPAYSPDFNPIERFWLRLKSDFFADFYTNDPEILEQRLVEAVRSYLAAPTTVASQCRISGNF